MTTWVIPRLTNHSDSSKSSRVAVPKLRHSRPTSAASCTRAQATKTSLPKSTPAHRGCITCIEALLTGPGLESWLDGKTGKRAHSSPTRRLQIGGYPPLGAHPSVRASLWHQSLVLSRLRAILVHGLNRTTDAPTSVPVPAQFCTPFHPGWSRGPRGGLLVPERVPPGPAGSPSPVPPPARGRRPSRSARRWGGDARPAASR